MVKLRRIGTFSAARFGFWLGFSTMFAQLLIFLVMMTLNGIPPTSLPGSFWGEVLKILLLSGAITAFSTFIFAVIYNWGNGMFGALELEFEMPIPPVAEEKFKNGMFDED